MRIHLVTFSDDTMSRARELCIESAIRNGIDVGNIDPWSDEDFFTELPEYDEFLTTRPEDPRRAIGWWSWKPAIIDKNLNGSWCKDGDILIYADAGIEFINNISHIIDRMDQDIFLFGNNWEHAHWCKRDVIEAVWPQSDRITDFYVDSVAWERFGNQCQASVIFFRVSDYTRKFIVEWLKWCMFEGGRLIDDSPSRAPNHPEFQEHRHDQAILTTMAYREGIPLHYWPAVYNKGGSPEFVYEKLPEYADDNYPILFHHHRRRDHEWPVSRELAELEQAVNRHGRNYMAMLADERESGA